MAGRASWTLGRNTAELYAEFRDDVDKYNKKQEVLLQKHIRYIRRQERIMNSIIKKSKNEIVQLRDDLMDNSEPRSINLQEYDNIKHYQKFSSPGYQQRQGAPKRTSFSNEMTPREENSSHLGIKLPPLWQGKDNGLPKINNQVMSRYASDIEPKALTSRALKRTSLMPFV
jgi:hypothetical protein